MKFIIFLIIFGAGFVFFAKQGLNKKFLIISFIISFLLMLVLRIGGDYFVNSLGSGLNMFLMVYDILAAIAYKRPQSTPSMPARAEDYDENKIENYNENDV